MVQDVSTKRAGGVPIFFRLKAEEAQPLMRLEAMLPMLSRSALTRLALARGLDLLERDPSSALKGANPPGRKRRLAE